LLHIVKRITVPHIIVRPYNRPCHSWGKLVGFSPWRSGFMPLSVCVEFMVDKVALGQGFLQVIWYFPLSSIPLLLHIHSHLICRWTVGPLVAEFHRHNLTLLQQ
jgi:hypothetical protein